MCLARDITLDMYCIHHCSLHHVNLYLAAYIKLKITWFFRHANRVSLNFNGIRVSPCFCNERKSMVRVVRVKRYCLKHVSVRVYWTWMEASCYRETWLFIVQSEYSIFSCLREHRLHLGKLNTEKKARTKERSSSYSNVLSSLSQYSRRFLSIFQAARWNKLLISYTRSHFRSLHVLLQMNAS